MSPASPTLVAGVDIKVAGQPLDPKHMERLLEVRVQDNLMLPDAFLLRLRDPEFELVDGTLFDVGAKIELKFSAPGTAAAGDPFQGEVATLAPQFEGEGCVLVVRGYDVSHKLNRSRSTRTFQDMTASDIAQKIITEAGLQAEIKATSEVYPYEQQSDETDWDYLWQLAGRVGYEVACAGGKIHFRKPGSDAGAAVKLAWGEDLLAFHPRATGVAQIDKVTVGGWDPKAKRRVSADASSPTLDSSIGVQRAKLAQDGGGGTFTVSDQIVTTQAEATALAQSTLDKLANSWLEADGRSKGNPKVRAGCKVQIAGIGTRFGGDYLVTKSTHVVRGQKGYETEFEISGRNRRTLIDLLTPAPRGAYAGSLVVGVVTNNDDPDKMGRVRVKFPGLDEQKEGWWARVASPSASGKRGMMMMPLVDDEVVVGFEHGDPRRPFVLGSLWNGTSKPDKLAADGGKPDGSFNLSSDKKVGIESTGDMNVTTEAKMTTKVSSDYALTVGGAIAIKGDGSEISIKGPSGSVVISSSAITITAPKITLDGSGQLELISSGIVQIKGSQVMIG
ncbi:MAG: VgrG-related protein [Solirubrobacterales bacterium]|nr:VgrG-related protein [Solirubrobacterales bacterium]